MQPSIVRSQRGVALYTTLVVGVVLAGLSAIMLESSLTTNSEFSATHDHLRRLYVAEAGLRSAIVDLETGGDGKLGKANSPIAFGGGSYFVTADDHKDGTWTLRSTGGLRGRSRVVEAVVERTGDVFHHALFAGNSSGDPNYVMEFGGWAKEADKINGDIYSGQDIEFAGDSSIEGLARAKGEVRGQPGKEGISQPIPDIASMNYLVNHDVNVLQEFQSAGQYKSDGAGGSAWQLPSSNPAHIFRVNPSDRATEYQSTPKADFFLEDPYESVNVDSRQDGSDAYSLTLSDGGNKKVYYIDGNLWLHNKKSYSFQFKAPDKQNVEVTFVVSGNIYFSDNLFYNDAKKDGVAFIAIKDPTVPGSGNIYFGDPVYGTLQEMHAFMYAEDNFYDNNLDATGSAKVQVFGMMSAGNHVAINRDFGPRHSRLTVEFDDRVKKKELDLPGLPGQTRSEVAYQVRSWGEMSAND